MDADARRDGCEGDAVRAGNPTDGFAVAAARRRSLQKVLIGERVGLIDLEDAAAGPPELDVGNLLAHLELLGLRSGYEPAEVETALLDGYLARGPLEMRRLDQCRWLRRIRLACIHGERRLLEPSQALAGRLL
jgi:Ser/Thr protein kinase RdoA (MazF antagonist)